VPEARHFLLAKPTAWPHPDYAAPAMFAAEQNRKKIKRKYV